MEVDIKGMINAGKDPKDLLIQACIPACTHWKDKLARCEHALKNMSGGSHEKSCMYPMRDYVTCVEACVQPQIIKNLKGSEHGLWFH